MRPPASAVVPHVRPGVRVVALTSIAMLAFASNCCGRLALQAGRIDAASFGSLRLVSGALMLAIVAHGHDGPPRPPTGRPRRCCSHTSRASFAYLTVSAATGALILFGAVQLTMFAAGWHAGERFAATGCRFGAALGGLVYLVSPGPRRRRAAPR